MKALLMTSVLAVSLGISTAAQADRHTASVGYAQSNIQSLQHISGVNLKYRYEWDSPISLISSFTYMSGKNNASYFLDRDIIDNQVKVNYYSLSVGPAYRLNSMISVYGLLGFNTNQVKYTSEWYNYESGSYVYMPDGRREGSTRKTSFMYGAGIQVNLIENLVMDVGYEGSRVSLGNGIPSYDINGFNIGVGYHF